MRTIKVDLALLTITRINDEGCDYEILLIR